MRELIQENIRASQEQQEIRDAVQTLKVLRREIETARAEPLDKVIAVVKCKPPTREEKQAAGRRKGSAG
jgi:hypothetical protein